MNDNMECYEKVGLKVENVGRLLRNPEVHYRSYISPLLVPFLNNVHRVSITTTNLLQISYNIVLPLMSWRP